MLRRLKVNLLQSIPFFGMLLNIHTFFLKDSIFYQFESLEYCTFLHKGLGMWWHRAWCSAPYISMVTSTCNKEYWLLGTLVENLRKSLIVVNLQKQCSVGNM